MAKAKKTEPASPNQSRKSDAKEQGVDVILCVDPGFAKVGVAFLSMKTKRFIYGDTLSTEPSSKKRRILVAEDNVRRVCEAMSAIDELVADNKWTPRAIVTEQFSPPRNAGAAAKVAMFYGALVERARGAYIPFVQRTPQEIRKRLCGKVNAEVMDIHAAVSSKYPEIVQWYPTKKDSWQHVMDAAAAWMVCRDSDVIRALFGFSSRSL